MQNEVVLVLDFGGQYKELIARSIRDMAVFSVVKSGEITADEVRAIAPIGIILTGGPRSVYGNNAFVFDKEILSLGIPVLGICYGMQLICHCLGGKVVSAGIREFGVTLATLNTSSRLFDGVSEKSRVLMSHTDCVSQLPQGFVSLGHTAKCSICACADSQHNIFGVQFHPEVELSVEGDRILRNFLFGICQAKGDYNIDDYVERQIKEIRSKVKDGKVILGLSGGVDSSVAAAILSRAIGKQLICIFVDHGLLRYKEGERVEAIFSKMELMFVRVNAEQEFLAKLSGVSDPEQKRKIIGAEFVKVFEAEAKKFDNVRFLAQGTIYPDVIESGGGNKETIKSHHNVGGLPKTMTFEGVIEPLAGLFKNEVQALGEKLGLPYALVHRQPFPGPGLAVRVIGDITKEKCDILRLVDNIYCEEIEKSKRKRPCQYFAVLTGVKTVGVMGDHRTYEYLVALRAVDTLDFMTCRYSPIPHSMLSKIAARIVNEVDGVNRVVYDITSKPPSTVEWE